MSKKGMFVRIDEGVLQRLKEYVISKYGKLNGVFSLEVQKAIEHWLSERETKNPEETCTHTQGRVMNEIPMLKSEILKHFRTGGQIPRRMLRSIIRRATGIVDRRSVDDRIEALISVGFLEIDRSSITGKLFRVVGGEEGNR
jgi:hypothetical protein